MIIQNIRVLTSLIDGVVAVELYPILQFLNISKEKVLKEWDNLTYYEVSQPSVQFNIIRSKILYKTTIIMDNFSIL